MSNIALYNQHANRYTYHRRRMEAMGFWFIYIDVMEGDFSFGLEMGGAFKCVCGRVEKFRVALDERLDKSTLLDQLDPARWLHKMGSFSEKHLIGDGFPPETVREILARGEEFDRSNRDDRY